MITAGDFKNGLTIELGGEVYRVLEFQHVKPGKGAAFVRTKLKNVITGSIVEKTFSPTDKVEKAHIDKKSMQYLYTDGELYYFMDNETFEQVPLNSSQLGNALQFIKDNMDVMVLSYKENIFAIEPPNFVELEVTHTEPGVKGDTATNVTKPATLETGAVIEVPLFVNTGEMVKIDTRSGTYISRA